MKLIKGDPAGAGALAQQSVTDKSGDPARANFILARVAIMQRDVPAAQHDFEETIRLSKDPRMLAGRTSTWDVFTTFRISATRRSASTGLRLPCATARRIPGWRRRRV